MKKKVIFITSSRSEYYLIKPLLSKCKKNQAIDLKIVVCGGHNKKYFGNSYEDIKKDNFKNLKVIKNYSNKNLTNNTVESVIKLNKELFNFFNKEKKFILLVLGDRYEALCASNLAHYLDMPVFHISGGDTSLGSKDEKNRNMISIISDLHFTKTQKHRDKLKSLNIDKKKIFVVGSLVSESIKINKINPFSKYKDYCLVSIHPSNETLNQNIKTVKVIEQLTKKLKNLNFIFTSSSHDNYGERINKLIMNMCKKYKNCIYFKNLGGQKYLNAINYSCFMLGNSSSGIIESSFFSKPSISILPRQLGRQANRNVYFVSKSLKKILFTYNKIKRKKFKIFIQKNIFAQKDSIGSPSKFILKKLISYRYG